MAFTISGLVYGPDRTSPLADGLRVDVSVNGGASAANTTTAMDGSFSLANVTAAAGAVLTVYLQGNTEVGVTVTTSTDDDMPGVDLYQNWLAARSDGGTLTAGDMNTADGNGDSGITSIFSAGAGTVTLAAGKSFVVVAGQTFSGEASTVTVPGDWVNLGTFTASTSTVTLTGTGSGGKVTSGGSAFRNLTVNGSGGTYTLQDALSVSNVLTVTAGTLDVSASNHAVTLTGTAATVWSVAGTFTARSGTVTFSGNSPSITPGGSSFYDLTIESASAATVNATSTLVVTHALTIGTFKTLSLNGNNLTMTGATFSNSGELRLKGSETLTGFVNDANSGLVGYNDSGSATHTGLAAGNSYWSVSFTGNSTWKASAALNVSSDQADAFTVNSGCTFDANGQTVSAIGRATVSGGTYLAKTATQTFGSLTVNGSNPTFTGSTGVVTVGGALTLGSASVTFTAPSTTLNVGGNFAHTAGTFTHNNGSVVLTGVNQTISGSTTFYDLTKVVASAAALTFTDGTTQTVDNSINLQGASGQLLTLQGSSTGGWTVDFPATQTLSNLSVSRSTNTGTLAIASNSTDGGNNSGWSFLTGGITHVCLGAGGFLQVGITINFGKPASPYLPPLN
jgi:hypothetical protein